MRKLLLPLLAMGAGLDDPMVISRIPQEHYHSTGRGGFYGYSGIVGNGKSRKKKTNKIHR